MSSMTFDDLKQIMTTAVGEGEAEELVEGRLTVAFTEIGYDSLAVLEIASQIQRQYGLKIPDEAIEEMDSPQAVLDYVNARLAVA
ncbi:MULTISPECIES: acyl carrier protein [Streptomyces]|uniref:acyl carrier protein n=1 Tax=Streptomyces TaxID=1883 RepID=UPI0016713109|nr:MULTISPECIES: acyl carrier protein [Streptomyces]UFR01372.1 acyl carrier protein [Streptomyces sp. Go40/10]GGS91754.1 actinorhodin polyketide synthase acyl carrier protein [Streptomyces cinerochromogenes]